MRLFINKVIILAAALVAGFCFLSEYFDRFYEKIYPLCNEVWAIMLTVIFLKYLKEKDKLTIIMLSAWIGYLTNSFINSVISVFFYFKYCCDEITPSVVDVVYINPLHENYISIYIAISGLMAIISFFYIMIHNQNQKTLP